MSDDSPLGECRYKGPIIVTPMIGDVLYKMKKAANSMDINVLIL